MSIAYIRKIYSVPFKVGQQVQIRNGEELFMRGQTGKLLRTQGPYLVVKGATWKGNFHPWDVEPVAAASQAPGAGGEGA